MIIEYCPNGGKNVTLTPDGQIEAQLDTWIWLAADCGVEGCPKTGSLLMLDAARAAFMEGKMDSLSILFNGIVWPVGPSGSPDSQFWRETDQYDSMHYFARIGIAKASRKK